MLVFSVECLPEELREPFQRWYEQVVDFAAKDRDLEWWAALALVDNVAPTPEAVKAWQALLTEHAVQGERAACARVAEGYGDVYNISSCIAIDIRARADRRQDGGTRSDNIKDSVQPQI